MLFLAGFYFIFFIYYRSAFAGESRGNTSRSATSFQTDGQTAILSLQRCRREIPTVPRRLACEKNSLKTLVFPLIPPSPPPPDPRPCVFTHLSRSYPNLFTPNINMCSYTASLRSVKCTFLYILRIREQRFPRSSEFRLHEILLL